MFCMLKNIYILLMFKNMTEIIKTSYPLNGLKWTRVTFCTKKLSALLSGITSKHHSNFYCLNCHHSFATENKLE